MEDDFTALSHTQLIRELRHTRELLTGVMRQNEELTRRNTFLLNSFLKAPTACIRLGLDGIIQNVNDRVSDIFGRSREEWVGQNFLAILPPERVKKFQEFMHRLSPENNMFYFYVHHRMPDKVLRAYLWCNSGVFSPEGVLEYIVCYCLPGEMQEGIANHLWSLQQQESNALATNQRVLKSLLGRIQISNMLDNQSILSLINEQYHADDSALFRYQTEENMFVLEEIFQSAASTIFPVKPGMRMVAIPDYIGEYKEGACRVAYRGEVQLPNTLTIFLESNCIEYQSTLTMPVMADGCFWGVIVVVREHDPGRWLDEDLAMAQLFSRAVGLNIERINTQKELERQQILSSLALEKSEVYSWQYDVERDVYYNNELILKRYGFPIGEQPVFDAERFFALVHPDDLPVVLPVFASITDGKEGNVQLRVKIRKPEGDVYEWFDYRFLPVRNKTTGKVCDVIGTGTCIERYKQTEQHLRDLLEAKNQAEESNRLKSAFIANMSHEIRTPLNAILGFSEILMQADENDEREEYMKIIRSNSDLLLKLIDDILDMSRIESGKTELRYTSEDLGALFDELYQSARVAVEQKALEVRLEKAPGGIRMQIDRARVTQIIMNFVNNAVKFTSQGAITLGYRLRLDGGGVYFYVRDTGCGIAENDRARIFHRFVKLDDFAQGTGLGLSICETLVKKMDGYIGVISNPGKGSEFWFTLPFK